MDSAPAEMGNPVMPCPLCGRVGNGGHHNDDLGILACTGLLGDDDGTPDTFSCLYHHLDNGLSPNSVIEKAMRMVFMNHNTRPTVRIVFEWVRVGDAIPLIRSFLYGDMNHGVPEEGDHFWTGRQPDQVGQGQIEIEEIEVDEEGTEEETGFDDTATEVVDRADDDASQYDEFASDYGSYWTDMEGESEESYGSSEESYSQLGPDERAGGA